ncbi:hypothetical protein BDW72DRAFT_208524 [Aspergillus terricola var. indicus]
MEPGMVDGCTAFHLVVSGDTCADIADDAGISLTDFPGITDDCDEFHLVVSGDTCAAIVSDAGITLDDFYTWNPTVGAGCSGLWLGYYVCVGVV